MTAIVHKTVPVQVWVDVDEGIATTVETLNRIPGVRTWASCQGTIGEGGAAPYEGHVIASWTTERSRRHLVSAASDLGWRLEPFADQIDTVRVCPNPKPVEPR